MKRLTFRHLAAILLPAALLCAGLPAGAQDPDPAARYAIVDLSVGFLRAEPDYESALETQNLMGTVVTTIDTTNYWIRVHTPEPYDAWINALALAPKTYSQVREWLSADRLICAGRPEARPERGETAWIYAAPSRRGDRLGDLVRGDILQDGGRQRGAFREVVLPSGRHGWVLKKHLAPLDKWVASRQPTREHIVAEALRYVGVPYQWGGASVKGLDCSGLVRQTYFMNGLLLPRNASQMVRCGDPLDVSHVLEGDFSTLLPGDLLFFGNRETGKVTHVALYIGDGHIIHASQRVRINTLLPSEPDYYENAHRLLYGRRILGNADCGKGIRSLARSPWYFLQP